ncbi:hypothetical protein VZT92_020528 [Zoarces viviparus]|uniref:Lebercilin-like protein n=1 Tax=Zoarces viviparus TaxID=48416 RepID=A0AAW1EF93_ZOAVI
MQSRRQQAFSPKEEGDGDSVRSSTATSRWSSSPRLPRNSHISCNTSGFGEQDEPLRGKAPEVKTSDKWPRLITREREKGKKVQCQIASRYSKLPPIKPMPVSTPGILSADLNRKDLKSQVWDLQQQLSEARAENKVLKRVQQRHTVALQRFEDSEGCVSQVRANHKNEVRSLQALLRESRACRDNLARQLKTTESKLLSTKDTLQHLQLLNEDHCLLDREELTFRLTQASAELEDKDKRILDLKRNLELCQSSFNRQILAEQGKFSKVREMSCYLQEEIHQLKKEIQDRDRQLETHNIYSRKFQKRLSKKVTESKMVQTDGLVILPAVPERPLPFENTETEEESSVNLCCYNPGQESLVLEDPEKDVPSNVSLGQETETCSDASEQSRCSEESPEYQTEEAKEAAEAPQLLEEESKTEEPESETSFISQQSLNLTEPKTKGSKLPKNRESAEILQLNACQQQAGLEARQSAESPIKVEIISESRELGPPAGKPRRGEAGSPQGE